MRFRGRVRVHTGRDVHTAIVKGVSFGCMLVCVDAAGVQAPQLATATAFHSSKQGSVILATEPTWWEWHP